MRPNVDFIHALHTILTTKEVDYVCYGKFGEVQWEVCWSSLTFQEEYPWMRKFLKALYQKKSWSFLKLFDSCSQLCQDKLSTTSKLMSSIGQAPWSMAKMDF